MLDIGHSKFYAIGRSNYLLLFFSGCCEGYFRIKGDMVIKPEAFTDSFKNYLLGLL
jgi:hypothetical protein